MKLKQILYGEKSRVSDSARGAYQKGCLYRECQRKPTITCAEREGWYALCAYHREFNIGLVISQFRMEVERLHALD